MKSSRYEKSNEDIEAELIFCFIGLAVLGCSLAGLFFNLGYALAAFGVFLWNCYFYKLGCREKEADKSEGVSCAKHGLKKMFQSWLLLLALVAVVLCLYGKF